MPYALFRDHFPEVAERETRTITVLDHSSVALPPGHCSLLEMYCDEPGCDCRRVFFYIVSSLRKDVEAVIAYGWETREFYARWMGDDDPEAMKQMQGPVLNFGSPQSRLAPAILDMVRNVVLQDKVYIERLKAHYRMFRRKIDGEAAAPQEGTKKKQKANRHRRRRKPR